MKIYYILFDNFKPVVGINLGTVYCITTYNSSIRNIDLYGLYYVKSRDQFVFKKKINLPKELILRYQYACENID